MTAATRKASERQTGWLPIETAPPGRERFCVLFWKESLMGGRWVADANAYKAHKTLTRPNGTECMFVYDGWSSSGDPQFWMPLPERQA